MVPKDILKTLAHLLETSDRIELVVGAKTLPLSECPPKVQIAFFQTRLADWKKQLAASKAAKGAAVTAEETEAATA